MTSNSPPHFPDTGQTGEGRRDQGDAVFEQASIWLARLREPESDVKAETDRLTAFQSWLGASPLHGQAFAEAERLWGRLEMPVRRMARDNRRTSARRHPFAQRMIAAAACLACLIGGATVWRDDISVRLQSDYHTGVGVQTPLDLADGSHITLNTDSAVSLDISRNRRSVRLLRGEAWFDVAKDPSRPFTVETPGGTVLLAAHRAMESITLDRGAAHLKDELMPRYAELIYNGFWFSPEREMLQALIDQSQEHVTGSVRLKLYKGGIHTVGRSSAESLYSLEHVTFEEDAVYDQRDAEGFIKLNALRLRLAQKRDK